MYTKKEFRKMITSTDEIIDNFILVLFSDDKGVNIYKVLGFEEVDETIYDTDEFYNCQIDEIIYASGDKKCKVDGCYDFSIDDIYEIKDARTDKVLYRKS